VDRGAVEVLLQRRDQLGRAITLAVAQSEWAGQVERLRCLRGIETPTAVGLCCEVGDLARFARAGHPASFLGLVPSEDSTGRRRRLGAITKTGSRHARRLLVEAAWHYRTPPRLGRQLRQRQAEQPAAAIAIGWSAQQRLHRTWRRMQRRGKRRPLIAVAVARELGGFCSGDRPDRITDRSTLRLGCAGGRHAGPRARASAVQL
jgi:transposase